MAEVTKPPRDLVALAKYWRAEIVFYEREFDRWEKRAKEVVKRYLDERPEQSALAERTLAERFNILWSNVQTIFAAVYTRMPKPEVSRRYKDPDPVGRTAAIILERALEYEVEHYPDFGSSIRAAVEDRLVPGRGVAWVRYEPTFASVPIDATGQVTEDAEGSAEGTQAQDGGGYEQQIIHECAPTDYVHWQDFGHTPGRTWEEVEGVWRRVFMRRNELIKRFGDEVGAKIPLNAKPEDVTGAKLSAADAEEVARACIYEIWDKKKREAVWISKDYESALDVRPDPLKLEEFFPCPKPLFATTSTGKLVPVPDYCQYQDQAMECDALTARIGKLTAALLVRGVYAGGEDAVKRLLQEGTDNDIIPVENWAAFAEKGGIKGVIDWVPIDMVVQALAECYTAREQAKQTIYEITGLSDIVRGASKATETATAQQIKSQFASLRIRHLQNDISRFASDLLRMKAQIMCEFYSDQTLISMSGVMQTRDAEYAPQALKLLREEPLRDFRIEVAADSMVELDEMQEKKDAVELITGIGTFFQNVGPLVQQIPEAGPFALELLAFGVRRFKGGRSIEGALDEMKARIEQAQAARAQKLPDPKVQAAEIEARTKAMEAQTQAHVIPIKAQAETMKAQAGVQKAALDLQKTKVQALTPPAPPKGTPLQ